MLKIFKDRQEYVRHRKKKGVPGRENSKYKGRKMRKTYRKL